MDRAGEIGSQLRDGDARYSSVHLAMHMAVAVAYRYTPELIRSGRWLNRAAQSRREILQRLGSP